MNRPIAVVYTAEKGYNQGMDIPLWIFLGIYLVALAVYLFFAFFNIYHMVRFGFFDFLGKLNTILYIGVVVTVLIITFVLVFDTPWLDSVPITGGLMENNGPE